MSFWRRTAHGSLCVLFFVVSVVVQLAAQMPGLPVLQTAFASPGVHVAVNVGYSKDASTFAGAAAWAPSSARFQLSAGAGSLNPEGDLDNAIVWGARATVPVLRVRADAVGIAVFAGAGGGRMGDATQLFVPAGASLSYRRALGVRRGISVYLAPFYLWSRASETGTSRSAGLARFSAGVDLAITTSLGVTVGYEGGAKAKSGDPGPAAGTFGAGVSYALSRPR
ncbi:MAG: hypothetical protein ABR543_05240 [Gemmatimonadaceae bacterium]